MGGAEIYTNLERDKNICKFPKKKKMEEQMNPEQPLRLHSKQPKKNPLDSISQSSKMF